MAPYGWGSPVPLHERGGAAGRGRRLDRQRRVAGEPTPQIRPVRREKLERRLHHRVVLHRPSEHAAVGPIHPATLLVLPAWCVQRRWPPEGAWRAPRAARRGGDALAVG